MEGSRGGGEQERGGEEDGGGWEEGGARVRARGRLAGFMEEEKEGSRWGAGGGHGHARHVRALLRTKKKATGRMGWAFWWAGLKIWAEKERRPEGCLLADMNFGNFAIFQKLQKREREIKRRKTRGKIN